ncbi:hypothetical protein [Streptomyces sp. NPDC003480]
MVKQLAKANWQLTQREFGPWTRIYRPAEGSKHNCVQLCIPAWNALDVREWDRTTMAQKSVGGSASDIPVRQARILHPCAEGRGRGRGFPRPVLECSVGQGVVTVRA